MSRFESSTSEIPGTREIPSHIAIIMDGNGRWAKQRFLPRIAGHQRGVKSLRNITRHCVELGVEYLTLFAFSSENWRRPKDEVSFLMSLFYSALEREIEQLAKDNLRFRVIGDLSPFDSRLVNLIRDSENRTRNNTGLHFTIAANYGGRWDILQAARRMLADHPGIVQSFGESDLAPYLSMNYAPEPDLFIRTGGEQRISNFLLWQLAYTELYFTDTLWPDFNADSLDLAIRSYQSRERRFGRTSEQLVAKT